MKYIRDTENQKVVHSPAMCKFKGETFLTFYECHHEGWTQQVVILKKVKDKWVPILTLPRGTGNPVLLPLKDKLYLCYSKFKKGTEKLRNVLYLWKNVDMFVAEIYVQENSGSATPVVNCYYEYKDVGFFQNLCPRVSALEFPGNNSSLLPVYDEWFGSGYVIVFHVNNHSGKDLYSIARHSMMHKQQVPLIQPTLYLDANTMYFEARNFGGRVSTEGITGTWDRHTGSWSVELRNDLNNYRESVLLFTWNDVLYRVWGAKPNRTELTIARRSECNNFRLKLNEMQHACYPNYLISGDTLSICFTEYNSRLSEKTNITIIDFKLDEDKNLKQINKEQV